MRAAALVLALVLAGCASPPADDTGPAGANETADGAPAAPEANATMPVGGVSDRMPVALEHFVLTPEHGLRVIQEGEPELPVTKVAETLTATAFYQSFAQGLTISPWVGPNSRSAWETTGEIDIALSFSSDAPATSTNPRAAGIPPVGAWFGTPERFAFFLLATDAPDTLEAGKVYTVHLKVAPPNGGFFLLEGEQLALHTFLSYQTADARAPSYVVGGPEPAGFFLPHEHFNLSAPRETVVLEESGELLPNPGPTADSQPEAPVIPVSIPADAVYVKLEVSGAPKAGARIDIDGSFVTASGDLIAGGSSSRDHEMVLIGPGNLAAYGRDLVAHITNSASPGGATYALKATAYVP